MELALQNGRVAMPDSLDDLKQQRAAIPRQIGEREDLRAGSLAGTEGEAEAFHRYREVEQSYVEATAKICHERPAENSIATTTGKKWQKPTRSRSDAQ
jgi:hypothetical protein